MTRFHTDGFEGQASLGMYWSFDLNWSFQTGTWQTITPDSGSYMLCCNVNDGAWHEIEKRFDAAIDVLFAKMRFCCHDPHTSELRVRWGDLSTGEWGSLTLDASGGGKGHVAWGTLDEDIPVDDFSWAPDTWYLLEVKAEHSIGGGQSRLTVRIDGEQVYANSGNWGVTWSGIDRFAWARNGESSAAAWAVDDVTLNSDLGAVNNDWIGDTRIFRAYPTGAGTYTQLLVSGGSAPGAPNWSVEDESPPIDTDFVYGISGGSLGIDTYAHSNFPYPASVIRNVIVEARGRTLEAGQGWWRAATVLASNLYTGGSLPMPASWQHKQWVWNQNPHTVAPWFMSEFNAGEFGIELL